MRLPRRPVALMLCVGLGGCSSEGNAWAQYVQILRQSAKGAFSDGAITRDQVATIPFSTLGYRYNGSKEAILILATDSGGEQLWTSASHVVLQTRGGRILKTVNLPNNVTATIPKNASELPALRDALKASFRSSRLVDFPDIGSYGVVLDCTATRRGAQTITIIGTVIATVRVDETCESKAPRWRFTDNYWLDTQTGFVWHSVQHLHPKGAIVQLEILRPPE